MAKLAPTNRYMAAMEVLESDPQAGLEELEELATTYPADGRVLCGLGTAYLVNHDPHSALETLEKALKREKSLEKPINLMLSGVYNAVGMPAHAFQARQKSGELTGSWAEKATPQHPAEASLKDMLDFEAARYELIYRRNNVPVALRRLRALTQRYPDYVPARNVLSTALYLEGELEEAEAQANAVLAQDAENPHALLNLARIWRLTRGMAAVRELLVRLEGQLSQDDDSDQLLRANLFALLDDTAATRAALDRFDELYDGPPTPTLDYLREGLERAEASGDPHFPVLNLSQLLPQGLMQRWQRGGSRRVRTELQALPGLFEQLPERLVYEQTKPAQAFCGLMLSREVYAGGETLCGLDRQGWTERFLNILGQTERGTDAGRMGILQALQQLELLPSGAPVITREGHELQTYSLQLHSENVLTDMTKADQKQMQQAVKAAHQGQYQRAMDIYRELAQRYPRNPRPRYNLAGIQQTLAEQSGDTQAKQAAEQEFERIAQDFPNYLYALATLAMLAIQRGDLEGAGKLLRMPDELQGKPLHVDEYAYFAAAQALLALERGLDRSVQSALHMIIRTSGPDGSAMRMFMAGLRDYRQRHGQSTDTDDLIEQIATWLAQADEDDMDIPAQRPRRKR